MPEYAASFLNYKALKKVYTLPLTVFCLLLTSIQLIKQLSATPTIAAQNAQAEVQGSLDPKIALRANKEVFFFRLVGARHASHEVLVLIETTGARDREGQRFIPPERSRSMRPDSPPPS